MPDVLVVGAGPVGLTLALQAHRHGASVRIVERRAEPFRPSRALIVQPRTLEVLQPLGVVPALMARSDIAPRARLHVGANTVPVEIGPFGWRDTAFPHLTMITQMNVETVLAAALAERGVPIEWGTELASLTDEGSRMRVRLGTTDGYAEETCAFLAGCDGADSTARRLAGIGWRGRPYRQEIVLADLDLSGDLQPGVAHVVVARSGVVFVFALGERARWRLLVARPGGDGPDAPGIDELQAVLDDSGLGARITRMAWSSRVRLRHGVATTYRRGRVLLAGDAAHTHSPAAAQGMNTGIQDAANLGWKLAFAGRGRDATALLDSYETERRPVAGRILALTDAVFWGESAGGTAGLLRGLLAPLAAPVLPLMLRAPGLLSLGGRMLSQLWVRYPTGPAATDEWPTADPLPRPGARLPDDSVVCGNERLPVHRLLERPGVHVLLQRDAADPRLSRPGPYVHVHRLTDRVGGGVVAVRPDGYVGYRCGTVDDRLPAWLARVGALWDRWPG